MKRVMLLVSVLTLCIVPEIAKADFLFGEPANLGQGINSSYHDTCAYTSLDGLSLYFSSDRPGGSGDLDIWVARRASIADDWSDPVNLGSGVNSAAKESFPSVSADNLSIYFCRGEVRYGDIWASTRSAEVQSWASAVKLGSAVNSSGDDWLPRISKDGLSLYYVSNRTGGLGGYDIWLAERATKNDAWRGPTNPGMPLNSSATDAIVDILNDDLVLFFMSNRPSEGLFFMSERDTAESKWSSPIDLGLTFSGWDRAFVSGLSFDGRRLYIADNPQASFHPGGSGGADIWYLPIDAIVDLNNDGIVDSADMVIIVDNWGTDNSLCDIGPMPWGDGIVDVEDLKVLAEHLFEVLPGRRSPNP